MNAHLKDVAYLDPIDFDEINARALSFAKHIEDNFEAIADVLLLYESFEVVKDETARTLDFLKSLKENKEYFALRINAVTAFLPRNQPLYALTCFVLIPSLMAGKVYFRVPSSMRGFLPKLLDVLRIETFFPNVIVSSKERLEFLRERSALLIDPKTKETMPATDAVIFTGTSHHADQLRLVFDQRTLFIANGSGHNPLVIAEDADLERAVEATLTLHLYNQGQDCAAPNAILVHKRIMPRFMELLRMELAKVKIGPYKDRSCRVGPISEPEDLKRIEAFLIDHREWLDEHSKGVIRAADVIVEPTIICKPLKEGGNFSEIFAPLIFVQSYDHDADLGMYFESSQYTRHAMYVTLYGSSSYIRELLGKEINGKVLHRKDTFLHNTHLHAPGIERGSQPYGGYGYGASSISINGTIIPQPTCPQRDIFLHLVKPLMKTRGSVEKKKKLFQKMTGTELKNVSKLLGLKSNQHTEENRFIPEKHYLDLLSISHEGTRYVALSEEQVFILLDAPNAEYIAKMTLEHIQQVRSVHDVLLNKKISRDDFEAFLYAIPKKPKAKEAVNRSLQLDFFKHLYYLLFGRDSGPRLAQFLLDADRKKICELLDL